MHRKLSFDSISRLMFSIVLKTFENFLALYLKKTGDSVVIMCVIT